MRLDVNPLSYDLLSLSFHTQDIFLITLVNRSRLTGKPLSS